VSDLILLVGSWLLTFLLHSTVWLGLAWLLLRQFPAFTPVVRDWIWKGVMLGSLLSPTLQVGASSMLGWEGFGSQLMLTTPHASSARLENVVVESVPAAQTEDLTMGPLWLQTVESVPRQAPYTIMLAATPLVEPGIWPEAADGNLLATVALTHQDPLVIPLWLKCLLGVWALGAFIGLIHWGVAVLRLRKQLSNRLPLTTGALIRNIQKDLARFRASRRRRIRFSLSDRIQVPVAFGLFGGEVCLPMRALQELDSVQQQTMLGHELAHLLRRDPLWLNLFQLMQRVLFMQPLLALGRREALHAAEEICDAWAIDRSGNRVALAECLTTVAQWLRPGSRSLPVACMAQPGSPLGRRVDRLLDQGSRVAPRSAAVSGSIGVGLVVLLTSMALFAPSVAAHFDRGATVSVSAAGSALTTEWNLVEDRMDFLNLEIEALQRELLLGFGGGESVIGMQKTLSQLKLQLQRLEQLSQPIRWNIQTQN